MQVFVHADLRLQTCSYARWEHRSHISCKYRSGLLLTAEFLLLHNCARPVVNIPSTWRKCVISGPFWGVVRFQYGGLTTMRTRLSSLPSESVFFNRAILADFTDTGHGTLFCAPVEGTFVVSCPGVRIYKK